MKNRNVNNWPADDRIELDAVLESMENPYSFENYCGACMYFGGEKCPFLNKVDNLTDWRVVGCKNFWD